MVNKELLLEHILKSDLTATEKRYLEKLIDSVKWISVNKRLPEESGDYLVFVEGLIENMMYSKRHSAWNATDLNCHKNYEITTVTHWMPLPEPPEMKGE